jgi:cell division FtsZ-interacting protein ZapD
MRIRTRISLALVVLLSSVLVLQPLSAGAAADCAEQEAIFRSLIQDKQDLENDLKIDRAELDQAERDLASATRDIDAYQHNLAGAPDRVSQEMKDKGLSAALTALGIQVALTILFVAIGPEGWGVAGETAITALEAAEHMHTALEVDQLLREAMDAAAALDQMASGLGTNEAELRKYADENNLSELKYMLDQEAFLAAAVKAYDRAWSELKHAGQMLDIDQKRLAKTMRDLQNAQEALYACLGKAGPIPSACEGGQVTNPNGAGVCR